MAPRRPTAGLDLRTVPLLSPLLALLCLLPAALPAQTLFDREHDRTFLGGISLGVPANLYDSEIQFQGLTFTSGDEEGRVGLLKTDYRERMGLRTEVWAGLTYDIFDEHYIFLRGRWGTAGSTGRYEGGGGLDRSFDRRVSWLGVDVLAGAVIASGDRLKGTLLVGPSFTGYSLDMSSGGRDVIASRAGAAYGVELSGPVDWSDRSWGNIDFVVGTELRYRLAETVGLTFGVDGRIIRTTGAGFESAVREDVREAIGREPSVTFRGYSGWAPSFSFAVEIGLPGGETVDPGDRAVEAVRARGRRIGPGRAPEHRLPGDATAALASGDTARAIEILRAAAGEEEENPRVWGTLGILLVRTAPTAETDYEQRLEAKEALERALELDPGHPRYLIAYGTLLDVQGAPVDARRVMTRGLEAAAKRPEDVRPEELVEAFWRRGSALERRVLEFEDLRFLGNERPPLNTPQCQGLGAFCLNWASPGWFHDWFEPLGDLSDLVADRKREMLAEYRRATELAPGRPEPSRRLLAWHARDRAWEAFRRRARTYADAAPDDPWAKLFLATGLYETGRTDSAAALFDRAVRSLPPGDREVFTNLRPILSDASRWDALSPSERDAFRGIYWRRSDPLYLTAGNEREMEHYARVALAEILFGEVRSGRRGWETDRGDILVRYGLPRERWQIVRDARLVMTANDWEDLGAIADCRTDFQAGANSNAELAELAGMCQPHAPSAVSNPGSGGRWIFWSYDPERPAFIFDKQLGSLTVEHMEESRSRMASEEMRSLRPTTFDPPFRDAGPFVHQIARFRAADTAEHAVEIYGRLPADELAERRTDPVRRGVYFFAGAEHRPVVARTDSFPLADGLMDFRVVVDPGTYAYSIEAVGTGGDVASVGRGSVTVGREAGVGLDVSDLLLARNVAPGPETDVVRDHRTLEYEALRCTALPDDRTVGVVFEIYGLSSEDGRGRYRVTVDTGETPTEGLVARLLRSVENLFRDETTGAVTFEREVEVDPGERVAEWFEVEVPEEVGETVDLQVTVEDLRSGETVRRSRRLDPEACRRE